MFNLFKKQNDEPLPLTAPEEAKQKWLVRQRELARIFFGYKFKPRTHTQDLDYVDRTLVRVQNNEAEYRYYFQWVENIHVEINDYTGETVKTGPGVKFLMVLGSSAEIFALEKATILEWAREAGALT